MDSMRALLAKRPGLVALMLVATLCMKFLVPSGWMISPATKSFTISICSDDLGKRLTAAMNLPVHDPRGDPLGKMAKAECPFAGLAFALTEPGMALLAASIAVAMALSFRPVTLPEFSRPSQLRPPLRGPPLTL